jgi:HPt (histidine-containing phosphotransfer) domain-containing protein
MAQPAPTVPSALVSDRVKEIYFQETPRRLERMKTASEKNDFGELARGTHTLKGNSRYVAADSLAARRRNRTRADAREGALLPKLIENAENEFFALAAGSEQKITPL